MDIKPVCGIDYNQLALVRVQSGFDGDHIDSEGRLNLNRLGSGRASEMNSAHFTLNSVVQNHSLGTQFDAASCVIIAPLARAVEDGHFIPSGLSPGDTWVHADQDGNITLPEAQLLAPEGFAVPEAFEKLVRRYPAGATPAETLHNRNEAISNVFKENNSPLHGLKGSEGMNSIYWSGIEHKEQYKNFSDFAREVWPDNHVEVMNLHMNSREDYGFERCVVKSLDYYVERVKLGERTIINDHGVEEDIPDLIHSSLGDGVQWVKDAEAAKIPPASLQFHKKKLVELAQKAADVVPILRQNDEERLGKGGVKQYWHGKPGEQPSGPLSIKEFMEKGLDGKLDDQMIFAQTGGGEDKWTAFQNLWGSHVLSSVISEKKIDGMLKGAGLSLPPKVDPALRSSPRANNYASLRAEGSNTLSQETLGPHRSDRQIRTTRQLNLAH